MGKQFGALYAGIDLMASYSGYYKETGYASQGGEIDNYNREYHAGLSVNSVSTAQARLGVVFEDFLVFGSAGVGYVDASMCASSSESAGSSCSSNGNGDIHQDFSGFGGVVGAGTVWKPFEQWSVGVNVDHIVLNNTQEYPYGELDGPLSALFDMKSELKSVTTGQMTLGYHF
jgi:hypothetical protein